MKLPDDYLDRVYAGVLGKIIGVYLGRPFEGWSYDAITAEFGEINYYVHEKRNVPLIVTDDDISGTFTFLRALADYQNGRCITPAQIGQTWLNYLIENRTVLWWGGMGQSTEHTAYLRLKHGIPAPKSGSIEMNGKVVAEQIGAQIFIDGWGMIAPGDPALAADFARKAASVSHDGEAIYGAQVVAALEAAAFVESDIFTLIETAIGLIPRDSTIYRLIADIREWHAHEADWRKTREKIVANYGYDKFGGNCHIVSNHALIVHALLYGEGNFQKSLMIVNTCGWDTDCNSGNVGCILGIRNGLNGIEAGPDWRGPVADRMYLPTADGGRCITDALTESIIIVNHGRSLVGVSPLAPKSGARFHFEAPGSVQGLVSEDTSETRGTLTLENVAGHSDEGLRSLALRYQGVAPGRVARGAVATFMPPDSLHMGGYSLFASPTLYSGQTIRVKFTADNATGTNTIVRLFLNTYDNENKLSRHYGPDIRLSDSAHGSKHLLTWKVPDTEGYPIANVGLEISSDRRADGTLYLDYLTWEGCPDITLTRSDGDIWKRAWVNGMDHVEGWSKSDGMRLIQDEGTGLFIHGTRDWTDYLVTADVTPHMVESAGIAARVQGMHRYYALLLCKGNRLQIVKELDGERVLAETEWPWSFGNTVHLTLQMQGNRIVALADGQPVFDIHDTTSPLNEGAIALICTEGRTATRSIAIRPL